MSGPFDLGGKIAVVTGANTGIGQAIALALAAAGADIAAVGRSPADETAAKVRAMGRRAALIPADLSSIEPVDRIVAETLGKLGIALPNTGAQDALAQYRALVDAQDITTESGRARRIPRDACSHVRAMPLSAR